MHSESDQVEILNKMADICEKKTKDHEKRIYLLRCILVYQQCYLLDDDDDIYATHAALADALQAFADAGGTSIQEKEENFIYVLSTDASVKRDAVFRFGS